MENPRSKPDSGVEEQLSAAFDREGAEPQGLSEERTSQLRRDWAMVRAELRALPMEPVDLLPAIRDQIDRQQPVVMPSSATPRRGWVPVFAVATSIAMVLVISALPLLDGPGPFKHHSGNVAVLRRHFDRLVPDPARCNVVVVNVAAESSVQDAVHEMLGAAEELGADVTAMHSSVDEEAEYSAGFLLTAGSEAHTILESLIDQPEQLEWNPADVGGRSHEEIREMFLASMKVPTQSDKVFGAMYVVNEDSLVVSLEQLPMDAGDVATLIAEAESVEPAVDSPQPPSSNVASADTSEGTPLIVIVRRQKPVASEPPVPEQSRFPADVVREPAV